MKLSKFVNVCNLLQSYSGNVVVTYGTYYSGEETDITLFTSLDDFYNSVTKSINKIEYKDVIIININKSNNETKYEQLDTIRCEYKYSHMDEVNGIKFFNNKNKLISEAVIGIDKKISIKLI